MFLTAFANLFGMGGSSLISRCLGSGDKEKARHTAAFCIWTGIVVSFVYGIAILLLEPVLFPVLGAKAETCGYLKKYVFWMIGIGAVPTVMNAEFAHLIRSEGYSKRLNTVLDLAFVAGMNRGTVGTAVATVAAQFTASMICLYVMRKKHPEFFFRHTDLFWDSCLVKKNSKIRPGFSFTPIQPLYWKTSCTGGC